MAAKFTIPGTTYIGDGALAAAAVTSVRLVQKH